MADAFDKFMEQDMILDDLDIDSTHEHMDKPEDILNFYNPTSKKRKVNSVDVGESSDRGKPDVANGQQPGPSNSNRILNSNDDEPSTIISFQPTVSPTHQDDQRVSQDGEQGVVEDAFEIVEKDGPFSRMFNVYERIYEINLNTRYIDRRWNDALEILVAAFEQTISKATEHLDNRGLVRLYINQRQLENPIVLPLMRKPEMTVEVIMDAVEKVLQSNESLKIEDNLVIHVATIQLPEGGGGAGKKITNIAHCVVSKRSIVEIRNGDNMCMARAIIVCVAKLENDPQYKYIRRSDRPGQTIKARDLCVKAQVDHRLPASFADLPSFEKLLDIRIRVVQSEKFNAVVYKGCTNVNSDKIIYLYFHNNHFDAIVNICGFYGDKYYCHYCVKPFSRLDRHKCPSLCQVCQTFNCVPGIQKTCKDCNKTCQSDRCFEQHKRTTFFNGKDQGNVCSKSWKCTKCNRVLPKSRGRRDHRCGESFCSQCDKYYMGSHLCYIQPTIFSSVCAKLIFFDCETVQETGTHVPNYCIVHKVCDKCEELDDCTSPCPEGHERKIIFKGLTTEHDFCSWLFSDFNSGYTVIAHNLRSFDGMFLLNYLTKNGVAPEIIFNNSKIMYFHVTGVNVRVIDSLNHMPMALSKLPKAFGLNTLCKGYFPHFFNTEANQNYVGPIPAAHYYGVNQMFEGDREHFLKWHAEQKAANVVFDFAKEMHDYCNSDVDILRRSCLKYRRLILDVSMRPVQGKQPQGVDPFTKLTIASVCFSIFRHAFLKPDILPKVSPQGIVTDQYSKMSILWLEWRMHEARESGSSLRIRHALNGGEKVIKQYRVDGYDEDTRTCYDFHGCIWHGCTKCYTPETPSMTSGLTMADQNDRTNRRQAFIERLGYTFVVIYQCQFEKLLKEDVRLKDFAEKQDIQTRRNRRDAFFGGRVNGTRLYYEAKTDEKIKYVYFTSLYPFINKRGLFPEGFPTVVSSDFKPLTEYVGFAKVRVTPPHGLYMPLLPYRCNGKLMFPLCRTCCESQQAHCDHTDEQRSWVGTYVTLELWKAIDLGYIIDKVFEVYTFEKTLQYNPDTGEAGLFTSYINTFLKIKQEASGYPSHVKTPDDQDKYINDYKKHEGICLEKDKIAYNPGLRSVSKLVLNSLWGKLGQRNNLRQSTYVNELSDFYDLLFDPTKTVHDVHCLTDNLILLDWYTKEDFSKAVSSSSIYVAAFTTAQARLKLYSILEKLGKNVLYFDTDSVIYVTRPGGVDVELGDNLGELTDELGGNYITKFVTGGAKNYAYELAQPDDNGNRTVCKVRGFTLNPQNSQTINFETVRRMVRNADGVQCVCVPAKMLCTTCGPRATIVNENKICRNRHTTTVFNRVEKKDYRVVYDKRVIQADLDTLPYGY